MGGGKGGEGEGRGDARDGAGRRLTVRGACGCGGCGGGWWVVGWVVVGGDRMGRPGIRCPRTERIGVLVGDGRVVMVWGWGGARIPGAAWDHEKCGGERHVYFRESLIRAQSTIAPVCG